MKIKKYLVLSLLIIGLLSIAVASQISEISMQNPNEFVSSKITQATDKISLEEKQACTISYYNETLHVYGYVPKFRNTYGICFNDANQSSYSCVNGTEQYQSYEVIGYNTVLRNTSNCKTNSFVISVDKGNSIEKKEVDFSNWGPCIYNVENDCIIVTCVSLYDGAYKGKFFDCNGGKSCQKFSFCEDGIKVLYKNSRNDFVEEDPTFSISKLALKEAEK